MTSSPWRHSSKLEGDRQLISIRDGVSDIDHCTRDRKRCSDGKEFKG